MGRRPPWRDLKPAVRHDRHPRQIEDLWREAHGHLARPQRAPDARARRQTITFLDTELRDILDNTGSAQFGLGSSRGNGASRP